MAAKSVPDERRAPKMAMADIFTVAMLRDEVPSMLDR
jgi:hypothetical protein